MENPPRAPIGRYWTKAIHINVEGGGTMKKTGIVGGIGPASTVEYYLGLVRKSLKEKPGGAYPEIVIDSVNMLEHDAALERGDLSSLGEHVLSSLSNLKAAGAEIAGIAANTEHIVWDAICDRFPLPVVSIVEATAQELERHRFRKVLVLGTEPTLRSGLYKKALVKRGIEVIALSDGDISFLDKLIYPNLENGNVIPRDRERIVALANRYCKEGAADAIVLGCTELPLAVRPSDVAVPIVNTTQVHIDAIYRRARWD